MWSWNFNKWNSVKDSTSINNGSFHTFPWKFPPTSMEVFFLSMELYFLLSELDGVGFYSVKAFTHFHGSTFTIVETSKTFHRRWWKLPWKEVKKNGIMLFLKSKTG